MNIDDTNGPKMPRVDVDWMTGQERYIRNQALEEAAAHILSTQIGFEEEGNDWIKGNNSGVKGSAAAIRALKT
jgi:hypothetical protein